jgi:hypothetical protein
MKCSQNVMSSISILPLFDTIFPKCRLRNNWMMNDETSWNMQKETLKLVVLS